MLFELLVQWLEFFIVHVPHNESFKTEDLRRFLNCGFLDFQSDFLKAISIAKAELPG